MGGVRNLGTDKSAEILELDREDRTIFSIIFTVLELSYLEADGFNLENKKNGMQFRPPRATQFQF